MKSRPRMLLALACGVTLIRFRHGITGEVTDTRQILKRLPLSHIMATRDQKFFINPPARISNAKIVSLDSKTEGAAIEAGFRPCGGCNP